MNLNELKVYCYSAEEMDKDAINAITTTLGAIVRTWEKQQQEIQKRKDEDDALYVTK